MKNRLVSILAFGLLAVSPATFAQAENATLKALESKIIALDTQGWEAYKNNDPSWFKNNTTEGFISISSDGTSNKAGVLKSIANDCKVASFALANFKFVMLDKNAALLSYTATQDAICGGKKAPTNLQVAVNYVNRGGKWLEAMYMQAP